VRILELTALYHPVVGGVPRYVEAISNRLAADGHTVMVVTSALPQAPAGLVRHGGGVTVQRLSGWHLAATDLIYRDPKRPHHPPFPDPGYGRRLLTAIRTFRPDVIHAHDWSVFSLLALPRLGVPVLSMSHGAVLVCARQTMIRPDGTSCAAPAMRVCPSCAAEQYGRLLGPALALGLRASRPLLRRVHRFVAVSSFVAEKLAATVTPVAGRDVSVLHPCVPDDFAVRARSAPRPGFVPRQGYLLYVGGIGRHKGIDTLLAAHAKLTPRPPLVMLGPPEGERPRFANLPADVYVLGTVSSAEVAAAMKHATAVVVPSVCDDAFPTTVTEAQLVGAPLVASAVGGIPEQVRDGETAMLFPRGDANRLADVLASLIADRGRREALGTAASEWAIRFTASALLPSTLAALTEAIEAAGMPAHRRSRSSVATGADA
jgi:glycosyltransferase involved in cell wall biosynthesis